MLFEWCGNDFGNDLLIILGKAHASASDRRRPLAAHPKSNEMDPNPFKMHGESIQIPWGAHSKVFQNHGQTHLKSMGNPFKVVGESI